MIHLSEPAPCHRTVLAVDIEGSTSRTDPEKAQLRRVMYATFEDALRVSGIAEQYRDPLIDRGDGILALIRPVDQAPKTILLGKVVPALVELLAEHNANNAHLPLRLRAVVHAGEIHYDNRSCFGETLDLSFRLLDAPEFKCHLSQSRSPLALVASNDIYHAIIRHRYHGIDEHTFEPLIHASLADERHLGWLHIPTVHKNAHLAIQSRDVVGAERSSSPRTPQHPHLPRVGLHSVCARL